MQYVSCLWLTQEPYSQEFINTEMHMFFYFVLSDQASLFPRVCELQENESIPYCHIHRNLLPLYVRRT